MALSPNMVQAFRNKGKPAPQPGGGGGAQGPTPNPGKPPVGAKPKGPAQPPPGTRPQPPKGAPPAAPGQPPPGAHPEPDGDEPMQHDPVHLAEQLGQQVDAGHIDQALQQLMEGYDPDAPGLDGGEGPVPPEWVDPDNLDQWNEAVAAVDPDGAGAKHLDPWLVVAHVYKALGGKLPDGMGGEPEGDEPGGQPPPQHAAPPPGGAKPPPPPGMKPNPFKR